MKSRPYCMYQKERHGFPVCSEQAQNRACAYPGIDCDVKQAQRNELERGCVPRRVIR